MRLIPEPPEFSVIVMAGQRAGVVNPIAERAGVSHKCLAPICGKPLILHVFELLARVPGVACVRVCMEQDGWNGVRDEASVLEAAKIPLAFVESRVSLADSAYAAADGLDGPILITTADNVLTTEAAVHTIMKQIYDGADAAIGLTSREAVLAARGETPGPENNHVGPYRFSDGRWSNCNLYALAGEHVIKGAELFREGGQFSKNRGRLVRAVGLWNVVLMLLRSLTLDRAMERLSKRFGIKVVAARLEDGSQAVDVDNFRTYAFAERILQQRAAGAS